MNFISFSEYLKTWRGHGLTDQQAAERLLNALRDPASARHVQGFRIDREAITPSPDEQRRSWRASERMHRIARWLESDAQPWRTSQRRDALERAWRRLKSIAEPEERHAETVSNAPEVLPAYLWARLNCVDASLVSRWTDDDDDPEAGIFVDWRAGKLTDWDWLYTTEYCNLEIHNTLASPTAEEVADRIKKSPITDQNKFWTANASFLDASGIGTGQAFRDLWVEVKYSGEFKPRRGRPPKLIGRRLPAVEL